MKSFDNTQTGLSTKELFFISKYSTPTKIQDLLDAMPQNFEMDGDSCMSVRNVIMEKKAHCIEAALLAALALWVHGERPLLLDLSASDEDDDHVVALFKRNGLWGAISKSNHVVLGYRDPIYRSLRELALSYAHEYYNSKGIKTLRTYSRAYALTVRDPKEWVTGDDAWVIAEDLCKIVHYPLMGQKQTALLRPIAAFEESLYRTLRHKR